MTTLNEQEIELLDALKLDRIQRRVIEDLLTARLAQFEALADEITRWSEGVRNETSANVGRWAVRLIRAALASDPTHEGDAHGNAE